MKIRRDMVHGTHGTHGTIDTLFDIDVNTAWRTAGAIARAELWRQIELIDDEDLLIRNQQASRVLVDKQWDTFQEQLTLTDKQKQRRRNAGRYHSPDGSDHWSCRQCSAEGDKFYIRLHICKPFIAEKQKRLELERIQKRNQGRLFAYLDTHLSSGKVNK
jgi:hypothetical protein